MLAEKNQNLTCMFEMFENSENDSKHNVFQALVLSKDQNLK